VASDRSSLLFLQLLLLLSNQYQQLGIGRQDLADGILELPSGGYPALDLFDPSLGNVLDTFSSPDHEGQGADLMTSTLGAMTGGGATPQMGERKRAGKGIRRNRKTAQQIELALTQSRSERSSGSLIILS
jgi:hypothetical protein